MKQESRVILAVVLSVVILVGYYKYFAPVPVQQNTPVANQHSVQMTPSDPTKNDPGLKPSNVGKKDISETRAEAKDIIIENDKAVLVLSTKGAHISSYKLKSYKVSTDKDAPGLEFFTPDTHTYGAGLKISGDAELTEDKIFELVSDSKRSDGTREIILGWKNSTIEVRKIFVFGGLKTAYGFSLTTEIKNLADGDINLEVAFGSVFNQKPPAPGGFIGFLKQQAHNPYYAEYAVNGTLNAQHDLEKIITHWPAGNDPQWAALTDRYFIHSWLPQNPQSRQMQMAVGNTGGPVGLTLYPVGQNLAVIDEEKIPDHGCLSAKKCQSKLAKGSTASYAYNIYTGPRLDEELGNFAPEMKAAVDYGWFSFIARPILVYMLFLHKFIPNWGLVIILLTFTIKILLHPVNKKSMQSMKAMQLLQPKLEEIKKRYPGDTQKQQQETMQLFRTHKVSPFGCLPMFLQLPVYIALYRVLWSAPEFYHAPFFGFYKDLSAPDPYFILPLLLTGFFVLQQILTPAATTDPAQRRMMMFMPVFFALFMFFLPVGLVLYILVNTVMSVVQQYMMKHDISFVELVRGNWKAVKT